MFFKTFIFVIGVAFVLANPIQEAVETNVEDNGHNEIEADESEYPTTTQESKVEENETPKSDSTESPIENPVKDQEEEENQEKESAEKVEEPATENAPLSSSTNEAVEEVTEVTTEEPKKDQSFGEKIEHWLAGLGQKWKEQWEAIKNKLNHLVH